MNLFRRPTATVAIKAIECNSPLVQVPFHDDTIEAIQMPDGKIMVSLKRSCESLGVDFSGQLAKLKSCKWATMEMISTVAQDGRHRGLVMIGLESLPLWLGGISENKVRPEVQAKLLQFQREARDVLARQFFGEPVNTPAIIAKLDAVQT